MNKDILLICSVDSYEKAWDKIREMTGEEEVDLLVRRFIEVEDRNFALFNYVNEQNNEIELLKEQIQQVGLQSYPSYFSRRITPTLLR